MEEGRRLGGREVWREGEFGEDEEQREEGEDQARQEEEDVEREREWTEGCDGELGGCGGWTADKELGLCGQHFVYDQRYRRGRDVWCGGSSSLMRIVVGVVRTDGLDVTHCDA